MCYGKIPAILNKSTNQIMTNLAFVTPKSNKAKNRFANVMGSNPDCIIEQTKENEVFLRSTNGKYFFWVNVKNDSNWSVDF